MGSAFKVIEPQFLSDFWSRLVEDAFNLVAFRVFGYIHVVEYGLNLLIDGWSISGHVCNLCCMTLLLFLFFLFHLLGKVLIGCLRIRRQSRCPLIELSLRFALGQISIANNVLECLSLLFGKVFHKSSLAMSHPHVAHTAKFASSASMRGHSH